jgi:hypothetical protein
VLANGMRATSVIRYLGSRRNLVGCALAAVGAALALLDPVGPSGLLLVVGFYALGVAATRPSPLLERYGFNPRDLEKGLQRQIVQVSGRVPPEVIIRIQRIEVLTRTQVLPRLECLPLGSLDLYLVERTVREYLPRALDNYLLLSGSDSPLRASTASTPLQVLTEELELLERETRRIAGVVQRADMQRQLAHRRFLQDRLSGVDLSG